jgi:hypothetical protein
MNSFETLGAALLTSAFCLSFTACDSSESTASKLDDAPAAAPLPAEVEDQKPDQLDAELVLESEPAPAASLAPSEETVLASAAMVPAPVEIKPQPAGSLRSASLLPSGTPEANVIAFTNLRLGKRDKAPIAGAGETGIHLDELEVGSGWASSRCEQTTRQFVVDQDERINLCFRVVHPREAESVTVEWARRQAPSVDRGRRRVDARVPDPRVDARDGRPRRAVDRDGQERRRCGARSARLHGRQVGVADQRSGGGGFQSGSPASTAVTQRPLSSVKQRPFVAHSGSRRQPTDELGERPLPPTHMVPSFLQRPNALHSRLCSQSASPSAPHMTAGLPETEHWPITMHANDGAQEDASPGWQVPSMRLQSPRSQHSCPHSVRPS